MSTELSETASARSPLVRWLSVAVVVAVVAVGVVAFAQLRPDNEEPVAGAFVPTGSSAPADLVGAWWPEGSDSLDGRLLTISPTSEFAVFDDSCAVDGMWRGSASGLATFYPYAGGGDCDGVLSESSQWFSEVSWFAVNGDRVELLDRNGEVALTLTAAPDRSTWPDSVKDSSYLLDDLEDRYPDAKPPAGLPSGVEPPKLADLVDIRWKPADVSEGQDGQTRDESAAKAFARFANDGHWQGSDGCNGQGGTWALHPDSGEWLATSGVSTLIGCANVPVSEVVTGASAVGIDGDELVFYAADGAETGRFVTEG